MTCETVREDMIFAVLIRKRSGYSAVCEALSPVSLWCLVAVNQSLN